MRNLLGYCVVVCFFVGAFIGLSLIMVSWAAAVIWILLLCWGATPENGLAKFFNRFFPPEKDGPESKGK